MTQPTSTHELIRVTGSRGSGPNRLPDHLTPHSAYTRCGERLPADDALRTQAVTGWRSQVTRDTCRTAPTWPTIDGKPLT